MLVQEVDRYNRLLKVIHATLGDLKRAIRGLVVMSEQLDAVYKAFVNNQASRRPGRRQRPQSFATIQTSSTVCFVDD